MTRGMLCAALLVAGAVFLAGCGGGGSDTSLVGTGTARGLIRSAGSPADFTLLLDGVEVDVPVGDDGAFTMPSIPPGEHELQVIGPDGMEGGSVTFTIEPGGDVVLPPIDTEVGGQIVGMVMKREDGVLKPLPGVEVVARSDLYWIMDATGSPSVGPETGDAMPFIYPPPPGVSYSAVTEDDGSFRMGAVVPGPFLVEVVVPGLTRGDQYVFVEPGRTAVADFELTPVVEPGIGTVQGTVTDSSGKPLVGALVEVVFDTGWRPPPPTDPVEPSRDLSIGGIRPMSDASGSMPGFMPPDIIWTHFATLTDASGKYSLTVPTGTCTVSAWLWGYEWQSQSLTVKPDTWSVIDFRTR